MINGHLVCFKYINKLQLFKNIKMLTNLHKTDIAKFKSINITIHHEFNMETDIFGIKECRMGVRVILLVNCFLQSIINICKNVGQLHCCGAPPSEVKDNR